MKSQLEAWRKEAYDPKKISVPVRVMSGVEEERLQAQQFAKMNHRLLFGPEEPEEQEEKYHPFDELGLESCYDVEVKRDLSTEDEVEVTAVRRPVVKTVLKPTSKGSRREAQGAKQAQAYTEASSRYLGNEIHEPIHPEPDPEKGSVSWSKWRKHFERWMMTMRHVPSLSEGLGLTRTRLSS